MTTFNADYDDLYMWFYVVFTEEYNSYSADDEQDHLKHLKTAVLGKTDRFKDWCIEQVELANEGISTIFRKAVINSIDIDALMGNLNNWVEEHVCDTCARSMTYCVCEEDEEDDCLCESDPKEFCDVHQVWCEDCQHHCLKDDPENHTCDKAKTVHQPETPPTSESDQEDSKGVQDHLHHLGMMKAIWAKFPA